MKRFFCLALLLLAAPGCLMHRWSATPDGKLVAGCTDTAVVVADGDLKRLESYPATGKPAIVEISPDGNWVLYNTEDANELWLVDRAAKSQKKIASTEGFGVFLFNAWSPASNRFAFVVQPKKDSAMSAELRIYNVKTGESFAAIPQCSPCYAWTPSGEALFAIEALGRDDDKGLSFGKLVRWTDGEPSQPLATTANVSFIEAVSEDEVFCASPIVSIPGKPDIEPNKFPPMGLFRISAKEVTRIGTADVVWIAAAPDRKRFVALGSEKTTGFDEAKGRLWLLDDKGAVVRVLKDYADTKVGKRLPIWLGNGKLLVPTGADEAERFETITVDGGAPVDVTDAIKAWSK